MVHFNTTAAALQAGALPLLGRRGKRRRRRPPSRRSKTRRKIHQLRTCKKTFEHFISLFSFSPGVYSNLVIFLVTSVPSSSVGCSLRLGANRDSLETGRERRRRRKRGRAVRERRREGEGVLGGERDRRRRRWW